MSAAVWQRSTNRIAQQSIATERRHAGIEYRD